MVIGYMALPVLRMANFGSPLKLERNMNGAETNVCMAVIIMFIYHEATR